MLFKRILIAVNDSEPAGWAADLGNSLAEQGATHIMLLHVVNRTTAFVGDLDVPSAALLAELRQDGQAILDRFAKHFRNTRLLEKTMREGKPADEIIAAARDWNAHLIVLGTPGRGRLAHLLIGSTAEAVVRQAPCPVLTLRQKFVANGNGKSAKTGQSAHT